MTKKEFKVITTKCFTAHGCEAHKKNFVYEHKDMYIIFMLNKSYYSDYWFFDFNCSIKALHTELIFIDPDAANESHDFGLPPRLNLDEISPIALVPEKLDANKYEDALDKTLKNFLEKVNKKGLEFIKEIYKKKKGLKPKAREFLGLK